MSVKGAMVLKSTNARRQKGHPVKAVALLASVPVFLPPSCFASVLPSFRLLLPGAGCPPAGRTGWSAGGLGWGRGCALQVGHLRVHRHQGAHIRTAVDVEAVVRRSGGFTVGLAVVAEQVVELQGIDGF